MYNVLAYFLEVKLSVPWANCTSEYFRTDGVLVFILTP